MCIEKIIKKWNYSNYSNYYLNLFHELCLEDPLQDEFRLKDIWIDAILIIIFEVLVYKTFRQNWVFNMSSNKKPFLKIIRWMGAIAGCVYIVIAYFVEQRPTIARFLLSRPRFLTENFAMYFFLYYLCISLWEYFGKDPSNRYFNVWFNSLLLGTALVTFGFWFLVMPYSWKYQGVSPSIWDLVGHFANFVWVIGELCFFSCYDYNIGLCSLFVVLYLLSCYNCLIWFYQKIEFICWVPYGPILGNTYFRLAGIFGIIGLHYVLVLIIKRNLKK
jgi:hypothetical protein